ncbi:hypothetical protein PSTG_11275 [Puccinia striiformis f. sp. tritici PST-78]|uniref:Uncharacterized protein n=1 Tax=Puccinia striiformis f. sp. tritici PST-78 TaxID=1165861 RepID=A0A0L0V819_9BASI|nr:hypothetical protein PSTG_11275 [Puccinia striiformis f. sp. tritici PST-78]
MFNDQEVQLSPTSLNNNATNAFPFGLSFDMNQKPVPPYVELPYPVHHQPAMNNCNSSSRASGAVDSSIDDSYVNYPSAARHLSASGGYNLSNQFNLPLGGCYLFFKPSTSFSPSCSVFWISSSRFSSTARCTAVGGKPMSYKVWNRSGGGHCC